MIWFWQHRDKHTYKLNALYKALKITKQAFHDKLNRLIRREEECEQMLPLIHQIREDHPFMSARVMYQLLNPQTIGRDRFERFCFERGFKVEIKRNFRKTTNSLGITRFENHLIGRELNGINQAWVSDITYYDMGEKCYYLTFIMDLYSRRIVGYSASERLFTKQTTIPALKMAINLRNTDLTGLIMHSDGGGQYYCKEFLILTGGMINSMAEVVYENPNAERINGTIKNQYLAGYKPQNFEALKKMLKKAVEMYNNYRPHRSLSGLTPVDFERQESAFLTKKKVFNKRKKEAKKEKLHHNICGV